MIDPQVLVVGAGPTGLAFAIALARQGVSCRIIDRSASPARESRAIAIQAKTLELFDQLGIVDRFTSCGFAIRGIHIAGANGGELAHLLFDELPSRYAYILSLPQNETERVLAGRLSELGIRVDRQVALRTAVSLPEGTYVELTGPDGSVERAAFLWVIGCDGAHSTVREQAALQFEGSELPQQFMLADLRIVSGLPSDEAHVYPKLGGVVAIFPLPGGWHRVIATRDPPVTSEPDLNDIQVLLDETLPIKAVASDLAWCANFSVHSRLVSRMMADRMFLVGDAAHIHSPALAQGMNTGIQDAANLAWKIALSIKGVAGNELLESYEAERMPVERRVLRATALATDAIMGRNPLVARLRDRLAPLLMNADFIGRSLRSFVSELAIDYRNSSICGQSHPPAHLVAGDRAPDADVMYQGKESRIFEILRGAGHHLLLWGEPRESLIGDAEISVHRVVPSTSSEDYVPDTFTLIRPDGYVAASGPMDEVDAIVADYWRRMSQPARRATGPELL